MSAWLALAFASCAALQSAAARAENELAGPPPRLLPAELCRGYWFLPITLSPREGYPQDRTLWFIYDTGASYSLVDPDAIRRVSAREISDGARVNIVDATAGPVTFNRLPVRVQDLDHLSLALGREIDGILEVDAFEDYLLTLDYADAEMRLESGDLPRPDGNEVFNADGPDSRPYLPVRIDGRRQRLLIDSGANSAWVLRDLERFDLATDPVPVRASTRIDRLERREGARLDGVIRFGPHRVENPVMVSTPGTQLFGSSVMRHFEWTFDQRRERVRVTPYAPGEPLPAPPYIGHGLQVWGANGVLEVRDVIVDSPADLAGVRAGDRITHWNGAPVAERGCASPAEDVETLQLTLDRGGETLEVELTLFALIE